MKRFLKWLNRDHPRIRGEHPTCEAVTPWGLGSPPHTRGTPDLDGVFQVFEGITPAYAGNTPTAKSGARRIRDHPRIRGEHCAHRRACWMAPGSPPHTRGTLSGVMLQCSGCGITPAYAGNTRITGCHTFCARDHPRIRGEHSCPVEGHRRRLGSPPHTRGTPPSYASTGAASGITPAYAGNTFHSGV